MEGDAGNPGSTTEGQHATLWVILSGEQMNHSESLHAYNLSR